MKKNSISILLFTLLNLCLSPNAIAAIQSKNVEYTDGDITMKGYLAWDDSNNKPLAVPYISCLKKPK